MPNTLHEQFWALSPAHAAEILRELRTQSEQCTPPSVTLQAEIRPTVTTAPTVQGAASFAMLAAPENTKPYAMYKSVAIITIAGTITRSSWWGSTAAQDTIRATLDAALADTSVKAILFSLNSPGGIVSGTKELADHIAQAATRKPCAAYADGLCASAAFWLAAATGKIYAPLTAQVGSVGVVAVHSDWSKFNEKMGIAYTYVTGGTFKAVGNENNPLSEKDKAYLQAKITALHDIFATDVTKHLPIQAERVAWAEGQLFLATEAKHLGLIQEIVTDVRSAAQQFAEEFTMKKAEFIAQHPDLHAEIQAEEQAKAQAALADQAKAHAQQVLALVGAVLGQEAQSKVQAVADAGISAEAYATLTSAGLFAVPAIAQTAPVSTPSKEILDGIKAAHGGPVAEAQAQQAPPQSKLVHLAEKAAARQ